MNEELRAEMGKVAEQLRGLSNESLKKGEELKSEFHKGQGIGLMRAVMFLEDEYFVKPVEVTPPVFPWGEYLEAAKQCLTTGLDMHDGDKTGHWIADDVWYIIQTIENLKKDMADVARHYVWNADGSKLKCPVCEREFNRLNRVRIKNDETGEKITEVAVCRDCCKLPANVMKAIEVKKKEEQNGKNVIESSKDNE